MSAAQKPRTPAVTAPQLAKPLPRRRVGLELPEHCPETLRQALARVARLADGLRGTETGVPRGTFLANQVAACLAAWRAEEISAPIAVAVLERLDHDARGHHAGTTPQR